MSDFPVRIYHNPACGTSRDVLGLIRNTGVEPELIEYLITPPSREKVLSLVARMGILDLPGKCGEHQLRNQEVFYGKREQTDAGVSA